jgi:hypothetical protein
MPVQEILNLLHSAPFQPFRIFLSNGEQHVVRHPELAVVGRGTVWLHFPPTGIPADIAERRFLVSLIHVVQIELI